MRRFHGNARADALQAHHQVVLGLAQRYGWNIAVDYDIQQREIAYSDKSHDYSTLDANALTLIMSNAALQALKIGPTQASPLKRKLEEPSTSPSKTARNHPSTHCFRCGAAGHLPAACAAPTTLAGKPTAPLVANAKSNHALQAPDGSQYCFGFASRGTCRFQNCSFAHSCSICRSPSHGAGRCSPRR